MIKLSFFEKNIKKFKNVKISEGFVYHINDYSFFSIDKDNKDFKMHFRNENKSVDLNFENCGNIFHQDLDDENFYSYQDITPVKFFDIETSFGVYSIIKGKEDNFFYMKKECYDIFFNHSYLPEFLRLSFYNYKGYFICWNNYGYEYHDSIFCEDIKIGQSISDAEKYIDFIIEAKKDLNTNIEYFRNSGFDIKISDFECSSFKDFSLILEYPNGESFPKKNDNIIDNFKEIMKYQFIDIKSLTDFVSYHCSLYLFNEKYNSNVSKFEYSDFNKLKEFY